MTAVVKVENISPQLPEASLRQLFGFIGAVRKLQWISSGVVENAFAPGPRECLIQFGDIKEANASLFLDGTEFADRKIKIYMSDKKLNEETSASSQPVFGGSQSVLPLPLVQPAAINPLLTPVLNPVLAPVLNPALVPNVVRPVLPLPTATFASPFAYQTATIAAAAAVANAANSYQIPGAVMDASRIEEIARTVYVGNIAPGLTESDLLGVFSKCGPVSFIKLAAGDPSQNTRFAFIEFTDMPAAQAAMLLNGTSVGGRAIKVNHSKNTIVKPPKPAASQRQVDEILKRVREAQAKITSKYSGEGEVSSPAAEIATSSASPRPAEGKEESRRRSRSRSSSRDRHRHRSRRSRSRSRDRDRKRRSPSPRTRSRSRDRDRDRRRSRSRDRHRRR